MNKALLAKLEAIARLNLVNEIAFQEKDDGLYAIFKGVTFKVEGYTDFDKKLKELKKQKPDKLNPYYHPSSMRRIKDRTMRLLRRRKI